MICVSEVRLCGTLNLGPPWADPPTVSGRRRQWDSARTRKLSPVFVAMGAILSFFFPGEDTGPDTRDTKEEQGGVKEVDKAEVKETAEVQETKVTVPKITEEAMEEADYEVVETTDPSTTSSAFPPTPQNSFASLPSLPSGQLDDGFEVISQRAEEPASLLNVDNAATTVVESKDLEEEEESPIANLKSGVEALLTDLSVDSAGPEKEEETSSISLATEETSTATSFVQEVQSIGEVQEVKEEETKEETRPSDDI